MPSPMVTFDVTSRACLGNTFRLSPLNLGVSESKVVSWGLCVAAKLRLSRPPLGEECIGYAEESVRWPRDIPVLVADDAYGKSGEGSAGLLLGLSADMMAAQSMPARKTRMPLGWRRKRGAEMTQQAKGPFEVKLAPQKADNPQAEGSGHGRMSIEKQFHGELEATSQGEMLSFMTNTKGSAGYVAVEKVTGTLGGRKGSFVLQHNGTMNRGAPQLSIAVVPDSGNGELTGLSGSMRIIIAPDGKHSYEMEYTFAGTVGL